MHCFVRLASSASACPLLFLTLLALRHIRAVPMHTVEAVLEGKPALCLCATTVLDSLCVSGVLEFFELAPGEEVAARSFLLDNKTYYTVAVGSSIDKFGVVGAVGLTPFCFTCPSHKRHCLHINLLYQHGFIDDTGNVGSISADPVEFEAKLLREFDVEAGLRKLTCISKDALPSPFSLHKGPHCI